MIVNVWTHFMAISFLPFFLQFLCQTAKPLEILDFVTLPDPRRILASGAFAPLVALSHRLAGPGLLFLVMALAFWRILLTPQYTWLNGYDLSSQVLPWLQFQAGEWHAGRLPLWSPFEWAGQNLIGQGQPGVVNPLNWLLFAAPLRRGWLREGALNWWFFFLHYLAGLNLYWLARSLGACRLAAVLGGVAFGLFGFMGSNDWPQMLSGALWAPLVFLFLLRSRTSAQPWRDGAWAGCFLGLSWLSGHHQLPIYISLASAGLALGLRLYPALLTFPLAGLLAAPQLLTGLAYGKLAVRWVGMENPVGWQDKVAYYVHEQYANPPAALLSVLLPGAEEHTSLFLGSVCLFLAILALRQLRDRAEVTALGWLAVAALLYNFGRGGGLEPLLYSLLPMVEKARSPSMAAALFTLAGAVLAALGLTELRRTGAPAWLPKAHTLFAGALAALFLLAKLWPAAQTQLEQRWFGVALASGLAAMAYAWLPVSRANLVLLGALLVESANMTYYAMPNRLDPRTKSLLTPMAQHLDLREYLHTLPGPARVTVDDQAIAYNFGDWHGVDVMGGYLASLTRTHQEVDWFTPRALQLLGVGYHVGPAARLEGSELAFRGARDSHVWKMPYAPLPRAWVATQALTVAGAADVQRYLNSSGFDPRQTALVAGTKVETGNCAPGTAVILERLPNRVTLRSDAACPGVLILSDSDDPGWSVHVDGDAAARLTVFHALRGVRVPAGQHTVVWTYSPPGFRLGVALAFVGLALLGLVQFGFRRARHPQALA